ncbi:hypothetical protein [Horticoccus sp. 23ND18S-11]|uniref:hypothetical protein n=1 Tax=Horticoccus sp. 23ND18S-11 TaxID=3391832 RepID=UPI0039C9F7A8
MRAGSDTTASPASPRWHYPAAIALLLLAVQATTNPRILDFETRRTIRQTFATALPDDAPGRCSPTAAEWALYVAARAGAPAAPRAARVDFFAKWVHDHSSHDGIRPNLTRDIRFTDTIAQALLAHAFGEKEKPSLGCGHRNNILKKLLHLDAIPARIVNILGNGAKDGLSYGHILVEYSDEHNDWITADADFLLYWTDLTGHRIGIRAAIQLPSTSVIPHGRDGRTGYETEYPEGKSPRVFAELGLFSAAIVLTDEPNAYDYVRFYLNPTKVAPDLALEGKSYRERYGHLPTEWLAPAPGEECDPVTWAELSDNPQGAP